MASFSFRSGGWHVRIRRKDSKTVTAKFAVKADAARWARAMEARLDAVRLPADPQAQALPVPERSCPFDTVGDLLLAYEVAVTRGKKGSYAESRRIASLRISRLAAVPLTELRRGHVAQYRDERRKQVSDGTIRRELDIISAAITWVKLDFDTDWLTNHVRPVVKALQPPKMSQRDRRPSEDELSRLRAHAQKMLARSGSLSPYVIELAIETAMRRGELASLEWQDIDFQRSLARLHETKSGESRDVPLSPTALQTLRALQAVTGPNGPVLRMRPDSITQAFSRACRQARVNNLRFHDLRHEAASRLVELGLSTIEVSAVTGHKSMQMLKRYTQLRAPDLAAKIAGLSASGTGG